MDFAINICFLANVIFEMRVHNLLGRVPHSEFMTSVYKFIKGNARRSFILVGAAQGFVHPLFVSLTNLTYRYMDNPFLYGKH